MAIEIPNSFMAAGVVDPIDFESLGFPTPILSGSGWQPYDPTSQGGDPDNTRGGFTRIGPGSYVMKVEAGLGADLFEAIVVAQLPAAGHYIAGMLPTIAVLPGTYGDGSTLTMQIFDEVGSPADSDYFLRVDRYTTGFTDVDFLP